MFSFIKRITLPKQQSNKSRKLLFISSLESSKKKTAPSKSISTEELLEQAAFLHSKQIAKDD